MDFKRNIIITGGAGFIGSHVVRLFVSKYPDYRIVNVDKAHLRGQPREPPGRGTGAELRFRQGRYLRLRTHVAPDAGIPGGRSDPSGCRKPRGPLDTRPLHLRADERIGHARAARGRAGVLGIPRGGIPRQTLLPHLDRRGVRGFGDDTAPGCRTALLDLGIERRTSFGLRRGVLLRDYQIQPSLALFGLEGLVRPLRKGLPRHLRHARDRHQLLQQLRPLPVPGKA